MNRISTPTRAHAREPLEAEIQSAVVETWQLCGMPDTLVAAIPNAGSMGQPGLTPGLPDLMILKPSLAMPVGFIELKRNRKSVISDAQRDFERLCAKLCIPHAFAAGRDEPIEILTRWGVLRKARA
jgi:hypothetical protein